ncbi:MAG: SGNH/GDSL hydrolase family protein [Verrucomicrobiota bacterium JB025]|nr:SGNH/GDSL hydrolase family protein [Verrucomicrobiota bacterium JB025]
MRPLVTTALIAFSTLAAPAAEQIVTLGDSLTFAYEAEFGFEISVPFVGTYGDGFGPEVRNWIEMLHSPYRNDYFDQGDATNITVSIPFSSTFDMLLRRQFNWSIPGLKVNELRQYLGEEASVTEILGSSSDFAGFAAALDFTNFSDDDYSIIQLRSQIANSAERLVFFIGGNDIRGVYGDIYNGIGPGTFVEDFIEDTTWILDWVRDINPDIPIVIVNVPHVGITPDVKSTKPYDAVKTGRVTAVLEDLNSQLEDLAESYNAGYADVFTLTLPQLQDTPLSVHGIPFENSGSTTGDLDYVWLNGQYSANFHPNTNAQALIANQIIHAFNRKFGSDIPPLTATEMLSGLLDKSAAEIDMSFDSWMDGYSLTGLDASDDSDNDGINAGMEFALGLSPIYHDSEHLTQGTATIDNEDTLQIRYPFRLSASDHVSLTPTSSTDLQSFTPVTPATTADGRLRATLPITSTTGFLRLEAELTP